MKNDVQEVVRKVSRVASITGVMLDTIHIYQNGYGIFRLGGVRVELDPQTGFALQWQGGQDDPITTAEYEVASLLQERLAELLEGVN
jgi:hypothetical protein